MKYCFGFGCERTMKGELDRLIEEMYEKAIEKG
jgi:hypothetical protein